MKLLENIFSVKNSFKHLKKYKIVTILGFKVKFRVRNTKNIRNFIRTNKPQLCENITFEGKIPDKKDSLAICAIFKNEPDIIEWIEYHKLVGVERFYLYDNDSDFNIKRVLQPYINDGTVIYHYTNEKCMQNIVYRDAVYRYGDKTKWMAMIDLDEYIVPIEKDNIIEFLKDYESYPAVGINWRMFDSNGYVSRPDCLVVEAYTRCGKSNMHIKSIFKPAEVKYITNPHCCFYKNKKLAVNEKFNPIGSPDILTTICNCFNWDISYEKIQINHYHSKSYEDNLRKAIIGYADSLKDRPVRGLYFREFKRDYKIQKYLDNLKLKMENINYKVLQK